MKDSSIVPPPPNRRYLHCKLKKAFGCYFNTGLRLSANSSNLITAGDLAQIQTNAAVVDALPHLVLLPPLGLKCKLISESLELFCSSPRMLEAPFESPASPPHSSHFYDVKCCHTRNLHQEPLKGLITRQTRHFVPVLLPVDHAGLQIRAPITERTCSRPSTTWIKKR